MNATLSPARVFERPAARALQHPGDLDKLSRIRESHNHDLAQWGLRLATLLAPYVEMSASSPAVDALPAPIVTESQAILALIRTELEAERREMQDAGLLPWGATR